MVFSTTTELNASNTNFYQRTQYIKCLLLQEFYVSKANFYRRIQCKNAYFYQTNQWKQLYSKIQYRLFSFLSEDSIQAIVSSIRSFNINNTKLQTILI